VPVWEEYAIFVAQMREQYPGEESEALEEMVVDGKTLLGGHAERYAGILRRLRQRNMIRITV